MAGKVGVMEFLFWGQNDKLIYIRDDAETASWQVDELSLNLLFPYDPDKPIERGMRVGFRDDDGIIQPFEVRRVKSYEPDHYQEITAEHIVIAELSDRVYPQTDFEEKTAQYIVSALLTNTGWSIGTNTASGTATLKLSNTSVWEALNQVKESFNVYITPRVVIGNNGITARYLDITPAGATWRGLWLSVDRNADTVGVTYDDTEVKTALYGYGGEKQVKEGGQNVKRVLTFADEVWTQTSAHPAKPSGQTYIEDPTATALYGRNGTPRFGFYQNADIETGALLLEKTWEMLKTLTEPRVTIDCTVHDLFNLGYTDQKIKLHDLANIKIEPIGATLQREIIKLYVDLLDPTGTRVTIGDYIPNIVYYAKENTKAATGGGGKGQSNNEYQRSEFETAIDANAYELSLKAYQVDLETNVSLIYSFIDITASGIRQEVGNNISGLYSHIDQTATCIRLDVNASNSQMYSYIQLTASGIRQEVANTSSGLYNSIIEQTATCIRLSVNAASSQIYSYIEITASGIRQEVRNTSSGLYESVIEQTATCIRLAVRNATSDFQSSITMTATCIRSEVNASSSTLYSAITQTATCIRLEVGNAQSGIYSAIEQNADKISLVVTNNNSINVAAIVLSINDDHGSNALIKADTIDIDGIVTALEAKNIGCGKFNAEGDATFKKTVYAEDYIHSDETVSAAKEIYSGVGFQILPDTHTATWQSKSVITTVNKFETTARKWAYQSGGDIAYTAEISFIANVTTASTTLHYLGY